MAKTRANKVPVKPPKEILEANKERNRQIINRLEWGMSFREIAKDLNLTLGTVSGVIRNFGGSRNRTREIRNRKNLNCGFFDLKKLKELRNENK